MSIPGVTVPDAGLAYTTKVVKIAQDQAKVEGQGSVALIEQSRLPPAEPGGPGSHVNVYA